MTDTDPNKTARTLGLTALAGLGVAAGMAAASQFLARDAERQVPQDGDLVDVDGARLHYLDQGSGPTLVMIHGLSGQMRNFTYSLTERLARDHRVIVVDRPGSGYSVAAPGPAPDIRAQARLIVRFIEKLGLDRPLLVGHSLGGAVSLAAALAAPERLRGLALLAPLTQVDERAPEAFRLLERDSALARGLLSRVYGVPLGRLVRKISIKHVFAPDPVPEDFGTRGGGLLALRPGNMDAAMYEISAARDDLSAMVPRYRGIRMPVRILYGREDNLLDPDRHGRLTASQIPGAELELIDGGHMLPVTHPDATARFIRAAVSAAA